MASDSTKQTISQTLAELRKEISERTKVITTGIRIPQLDESQTINDDDIIILETQGITKKITAKALKDYIKA